MVSWNRNVAERDSPFSTRCTPRVQQKSGDTRVTVRDFRADAMRQALSPNLSPTLRPFDRELDTKRILRLLRRLSTGSRHRNFRDQAQQARPRACRRVKGTGVGCEGRGDIGVRFDVSTSSTHRKLNELRDGLFLSVRCFELVETHPVEMLAARRRSPGVRAALRCVTTGYIWRSVPRGRRCRS